MLIKENIVDAVASPDIQAKIFTIRGVQVMLAPDLAELYEVSTSAFNQAVKRNLKRFPQNFRFQLTHEELEEVITNCDNPDRLRFAPTLPFAFTEQGVAMLSGVLKSDVAVAVSIRIMNTFVAMRQMLASMYPLLARIEKAEKLQMEDHIRQINDQIHNEERFSEIFNAMSDKTFPEQKIFYEGEVFDADAFISRHVLIADKSILLIDNWIDITALEVLSKKKDGVAVEIVTSSRGNRLTAHDIDWFNEQYGGLSVKNSQKFHDRFLIIDDSILYLCGASLKDIGKKCFAFTRLDEREIPLLKDLANS